MGEVTDARIFELARSYRFGGEKAFLLIHQTDPMYAAACEMPNNARWSASVVSAEALLAFSRALLAEPAAGAQVSCAQAQREGNPKQENDS